MSEIQTVSRVRIKKDNSDNVYYVANDMEGYYNAEDGRFYDNPTFSGEPLESKETIIYIDKDNNNMYRYDGESFIQLSGGGGGETTTIYVTAWYRDEQFYDNPTGGNVVRGKANLFYIDLNTNDLYRYDGTIFIKLCDNGGSSEDKMNKANPEGTGAFSINRKSNTTIGAYSSTLGYDCTAIGVASHAEGVSTQANENYSHAEGDSSRALGRNTHAEGYQTLAQGNYSHAEGNNTFAYGTNSHAEGYKSKTYKEPTGSNAANHAEGYQTEAKHLYTHAEGYKTVADNHASHAEGYETNATGNYSHAEGKGNTASGNGSHVEGINNEASGVGAHAEGQGCVASKPSSHAGGHHTIANQNFMTSIGIANDPQSDSLFEIGNGTYNSSSEQYIRSNAFRVTNTGDAIVTNEIKSKGATITGAPLNIKQYANEGSYLVIYGADDTYYNAMSVFNGNSYWSHRDSNLNVYSVAHPRKAGTMALTSDIVGSAMPLTGYSKPASTSAIVATDTVNEAIGKLEKGLENAGGSGVSKLPWSVFHIYSPDEATTVNVLPYTDYTSYDYSGGTTTTYPNNFTFSSNGNITCPYTGYIQFQLNDFALQSVEELSDDRIGDILEYLVEYKIGNNDYKSITFTSVIGKKIPDGGYNNQSRLGTINLVSYPIRVTQNQTIKLRISSGVKIKNKFYNYHSQNDVTLFLKYIEI